MTDDVLMCLSHATLPPGSVVHVEEVVWQWPNRFVCHPLSLPRLDSSPFPAVSPWISNHKDVWWGFDCYVWAIPRKHEVRWHCVMPHVVAAGQKGVRAAGQACPRMPAPGQSAVPGASGGDGGFRTLHSCSGIPSPEEAIPESGACQGGTLQSSGPARKFSNMTSYYSTAAENILVLFMLCSG